MSHAVPSAGARERSSAAYLCICTRGADCTRMNARLARASPTVWSTRRIRGRSERVGWSRCDDSAASALRALLEEETKRDSQRWSVARVRDRGGLPEVLREVGAAQERQRSFGGLRHVGKEKKAEGAAAYTASR